MREKIGDILKFLFEVKISKCRSTRLYDCQRVDRLSCLVFYYGRAYKVEHSNMVVGSKVIGILDLVGL